MQELSVMRVITFLFLVAFSIYWWLKSREANKKKPKTQKNTLKQHIQRTPLLLVSFLLLLQLLGMNIFLFNGNRVFQAIGFIFVLLGITISIAGRVKLDTNWTGGFEYQIKHHHSLITTGIYTYIRHPIYTGITLVFLGVEILVQSYLFLSSFVVFYWFYYWAIREEKLLLHHFGKSYKIYMSKNKMFIPYIF